QQDGKLKLRAVASVLLRQAADLRNTFTGLFGAETARAPAVGVTRHPLERIFGVVGTEQDRRSRLLDRLRTELQRGEFDDFAVVTDVVLTPEDAQRLNAFAQMLPAAREVHPHHLRFFRKPAGADAQNQASARVKI